MSETAADQPAVDVAEATDEAVNPRAAYIASLRTERHDLERRGYGEAVAKRRIAEIDEQLAQYDDAPAKRGAAETAAKKPAAKKAAAPAAG